ncbi:MAG: BET3 family protein [archaeon]|nr:BET3 family protein [archaeon]
MSAKPRTEFLSKVEKINAELLTLTYGSLIVRLIKDFEKPEEINEQLEKMGYNIGIRMIDDFLAKSCIPPPTSFKDSIEIIRNQAFKFYLGIKAETFVYGQKEYALIFNENLLNDFVELPEKYQDLWYSNILCGVIRGAYEAINIKVECKYNKDTLKGHDTNEIRIKLIEIIEEKLADDEV